jgi:hypothetical protein
MSLAGVGLIGLGAVVAFANALTTRSLWSSPMFERPQKIAQTVLMWLVPGTFVVTRLLVRAPDRIDPADPTVGGSSYVADPAGYHHGHGDGGSP